LEQAMKWTRWALSGAFGCGAALIGCGSDDANGSGAAVDAGSDAGISLGPDTGSGGDWFDGGPSLDAAWPTSDGGYVVADADILAADRFITKVVSFTPGTCAGYGQSSMPTVVEGPPIGGGADMGSTDVVSLGGQGEIVVSFEPNTIVDGPGADFIVFENAFDVAGNASNIFAEPGEVSVSNDGVIWTVFPCTATAYPYGECAGWHPVFSNPDNGISPVDPAAAGGDAFDLADLADAGVTEVRYVRIRDKTTETCPAGAGGPTSNGFDLDAVAIVNASMP
jgi:hypothetical protein